MTEQENGNGQTSRTTFWRTAISESPKHVFVVCGLNALLVVPVAIALTAVRVSPSATEPSETPCGYTWALGMWCVPMFAGLIWLVRRNDLAFERRCCWWSLSLLIPIGFLLDLLFGNTFFRYPASEATIGALVPAVGGPLPVEEFVFFIAAFSLVLLTYVWADNAWLAAYHPQRTHGAGAPRFRFKLLAVPALFLAIAVFYKLTFSQHTEGFPWYLAYILGVAIAPPLGFFPSVALSINWQAFVFTQLVMVLICVIFEATLGGPYAWWEFRPEMMTGIFIPAWGNIPIEEPFVWVASTFTIVVTYECVKSYRRSSESASLDEGSSHAA